MGIKVEVLTGRKYGRLLVLERAISKDANVLWHCVCDCGERRINQSHALKSGAVVSCGCWRAENARKHGLSKHPLYSTWKLMLARCYKPLDHAYPRYGARGIKVCERWRNSFAAFIEDVGEKPAGAQLDRINNDGDYSPENCRWATPMTQSNNRRSNSVIFYKNQSKTIMEWSRELGMCRRTISARLHKGWTAERILETPIRKRS